MLNSCYPVEIASAMRMNALSTGTHGYNRGCTMMMQRIGKLT